MKRLFEACHNYSKTKDGSYFKLLRENAKIPTLKMAKFFADSGADWQPSPAEIADLEAGRLQPWFPCLSQSVIKVYDVGVSLLHKIRDEDCEVPPHLIEVVENQIDEDCKTLGFEFAKQKCRAGAWLYCITDSATKLYYCHQDIDAIKAAIMAAKAEQVIPLAPPPPAKRGKPAPPVEFDPFEL